ncbi:putative mitochondrial protein, partial [Mucuna pruriens]
MLFSMIPQGVEHPNPNQVCKVVKSLYEQLSQLFIELGFSQATANHSLFTKQLNRSFTTLLVYIDDIILVANNVDDIKFIKSTLNIYFEIKDLGILKYFLGLKTTNSPHNISLCQRQYYLNFLSDVGLLNCKPTSTPLDPRVCLHQDNDPLFTDSHREITLPHHYSIHELSTFVHYTIAIKVLQYIKGTPRKGLFLPRSLSLQLLGFTNANWRMS